MYRMDAWSHTILFQSTLLQEERRLCEVKWNKKLYFNPRSYKRSDQNQISIFDMIRISIHAPTRGATLKVGIKRSVKLISIHAPTRGATCMNTIICCVFIFQSTLLQEERRQKCTIILILICNNYCIVSIKSHQHYNNYFM